VVAKIGAAGRDRTADKVLQALPFPLATAADYILVSKGGAGDSPELRPDPPASDSRLILRLVCANGAAPNPISKAGLPRKSEESFRN